MRVPFLDLVAQYAALGPEIEAAVRRVLASGRYILGEDVAALEREVAGDHGLPHAVAVSSGSDALLAALWGCGVGPGDEVVTTAMSFFASAGAIARLGATPVFADIDPATFGIDPASALAKITSRTKAILPVHLFGRVVELAPLIATGLPVVEDAAQAYGASIGAGRAATLSFFPSKNLGAAGDAGMVLTSDAELADRLRLYRVHGARPKYHHHLVGANLRMDTLQAAILRAKRPCVAAWTARRRANAERYRELLAGTPLGLPADAPGHVWHQFVVRAPKRDALRAFLAAREIETEVYYPLPLHRQPCFAPSGFLPEAERAAGEVLALPVHAELAGAQLEYVAAAIAEFYR
jgi:dTDP-4-amino-4,6-dideoxygalactose transaminase